MTRTDVHRPSVIEPLDYEFVGVEYQRTDDIGELMMLAQQRERIWAHMKETGGVYSRHRHGGNCHVCGADCIYTALFYHPKTNTYIRTGFDCADKMDMGDEQLFRAFRKGICDARKNKAGLNKAQALLADRGLSRAWEIYELESDPTEEEARKCKACNFRGCDECYGRGYFPNAYQSLCSIVSNLVRYGGASDKQFDYLAKLIDQVDNWAQREAERKAKREAERAKAEDCPTGRTTVIGTVLSTRVDEGYYGRTTIKMLVKDDRGFKVWGSVPSALWSVTIECHDDEGSWKQQRALENYREG
jgi:hypothetical protein